MYLSVLYQNSLVRTNTLQINIILIQFQTVLVK